MPRNTVATLSVAQGTGKPASPYTHFSRPPNGSDPQHGGFWSPPDAAQWYWPTVGVSLGDGNVHVIAMRMENAGSGLFPFATAGMDVLSFERPSANPMAWPQPNPSTLPHVNNTWVLGCAAGVGADGFVYILGSNNGTGMMTRIKGRAFSAHQWDQLTYFVGGAAGWVPFGGGLLPSPLFPFVPSETTLAFHPAMRLWYIVWVNTFLSKSIMFRTAPSPEGPWSDGIPVYDIPLSQLAGAFCYAGKAHPELSPAGALEVITSYMCNTPQISDLLDRPDIYVPQLVRTSISL